MEKTIKQFAKKHRSHEVIGMFTEKQLRQMKKNKPYYDELLCQPKDEISFCQILRFDEYFSVALSITLTRTMQHNGQIVAQGCGRSLNHHFFFVGLFEGKSIGNMELVLGECEYGENFRYFGEFRDFCAEGTGGYQMRLQKPNGQLTFVGYCFQFFTPDFDFKKRIFLENKHTFNGSAIFKNNRLDLHTHLLLAQEEENERQGQEGENERRAQEEPLIKSVFDDKSNFFLTKAADREGKLLMYEHLSNKMGLIARVLNDKARIFSPTDVLSDWDNQWLQRIIGSKFPGITKKSLSIRSAMRKYYKQSTRSLGDFNEIEEIVQFLMAKKKKTRGDSYCSICLNAVFENFFVHFPCGGCHCFHMGCIEQWLESKSSCPNCREHGSLLKNNFYFSSGEKMHPTKEYKTSVLSEFRDFCIQKYKNNRGKAMKMIAAAKSRI